MCKVTQLLEAQWESVCTQSRGSVCRWLCMEQCVWVSGGGGFYFGFRLFVLDHRSLSASTSHWLQTHSFHSQSRTWSSEVTWRSDLTPSPPNMELVRATNPSAIGWYKTETTSSVAVASDQNHLSLSTHTDYPVAFELSGFQTATNLE